MNMEGSESTQFLQCLAQWKSHDSWEQPRGKGESPVKIGYMEKIQRGTSRHGDKADQCCSEKLQEQVRNAHQT